MLKRFVAFMLVAPSTIASTPVDTGPSAVVRQFYEWRLRSDMGGSPSMAQLDAMRGRLTGELACLLQIARKFDDFTVATYPNIKPLYAEGDLFSGGFMTPSSFKLEDQQIKGTDATVRIRFTANAFLGEGKWTGTVHLRKTGTEWRISDVQYPAEFVVGNPVLTDVRLTKTLYNVLAHDADGWNATSVLDCRKK